MTALTSSQYPPLIIGDTMYPRPQVSRKALPACDSSSGSFGRGSDLLVVRHVYVDACHLCLLRLRHRVCLVRTPSVSLLEQNLEFGGRVLTITTSPDILQLVRLSILL
jgi:hypothetical protein